MSMWNFLLAQTKNKIVLGFRDKLIERIIDDGKIIATYVKQENKFKCSHAFYGHFKQFPQYKVIGVIGVHGSLSFQSIWDVKRHDVMLAAGYDGYVWNCSLFSEDKVDVSEIASFFGGGGHMNASGFHSENLFEIFQVEGKLRDLK